DPVSGRTRKFIPAGPYDNPKLDPSYLQSLKMLPEKLQKAWIEGDWDTFQGQFFEEWDPEIHVLKEHFEPPPEWPRYHALDWGSDKPYAYGLFTFLKGKPYLFAELYGWSGVPNVRSEERRVGKECRARGERGACKHDCSDECEMCVRLSRHTMSR